MGKIITLEGIDGTGKGTQTRLLKQSLEQRGLQVGELSFPAYETFFGGYVGKYLTGKLDVPADRVDQHSMALWFALDRWEAVQQFDFDKWDVVLINRYVLSNAVYQSIRDIDKNGIDLLDFCMELEYGHFHLPRPDLQLILDVAPTDATKNVEKKGFRDYVGEEKDVYEAAGSIQQRGREKYLQYAQRLPEAVVIPCMEDGKLLPLERVHEMILKAVEPLVAPAVQ